MADEKSGMEKLRAAAEQSEPCGCSICEASGIVCNHYTGCNNARGRALALIADQIEREHAAELAAAKRGMTDEARGVVEALRDLGPVCSWRDVLAVFLGHEANPIGLVLRNRLIELIEQGGKPDGSTSDGYHTFDELYHHRAVLFSVVVSANRSRAWKSKRHHDGTMYDGMFIVGIDAPDGQATYHYDVDPYWDMFDCKELPSAPQWDGHTPSMAIDRIGSLRGKPDVDVEALRELARRIDDSKGGAFSSCYYFRKRGESCAECPAATKDCDGAMLADVADRIRKAVDGAPERGNIVARCRPCRTEREAAADWVEANGGLSIVENRYAENALVKHDVCKMLGIPDVSGSVGYQSIVSELDKRLMPQGMAWTTFDDGGRVEFGSAVDGLDGPCEKFVFTHGQGGVCQLQDADGGMVNVLGGERVKRPEPEVLGADKLPIEVGETVYTTFSGMPFLVKEIDGEFLKSVNCGFLRAGSATHTPPDTQERIDDDASTDPSTYCDEVLGWDAERIVHRSDYAAQNEAMIADLLRRQRELDAKTMGGGAV